MSVRVACAALVLVAMILLPAGDVLAQEKEKKPNTIVIYGTDNGAETMSWPDGGITPFHGEKGTTWEGGFRVPCVVRWPGTIKPGTIVNDMMSQEDWLPTLLAAAGVPGIVEKVKKGHQANGKTWKVFPYFTTRTNSITK